MANWTKTPNAIMEAIPDMGAAEMRITFALVRQIYGYHREGVKLTYGDLMALTGLRSRSSINRGIKQVLARGFFKRDRSRLVWRASIPDPEARQGGPVNRRRSTAGDNTINGLSTKIVPRDGRRIPRGPRKPQGKGAWRGPKLSDEDDIRMPELLDTAEFRELWAGFLQHVRELARPMTLSSAERNLKRLASVGYKEAVARVNRAVERNWLSLFYPGDEKDFRRLGEKAAAGPEEEAWRLVCTLSSNGKLSMLSPGVVRRAVMSIGEDRLYRMNPEARPFVKREFMEALKYADESTA